MAINLTGSQAQTHTQYQPTNEMVGKYVTSIKSYNKRQTVWKINILDLTSQWPVVVSPLVD